jgi:hypothetical protein
MIKPGTITWARTVPEGRRYHSQIGKLVEKAKAALLPDLENLPLPERSIPTR